MKVIKSALIDEVMNFETTEDLDIYLKNKGYERRDGDGFFEYGIPNQPAELRVTEDDGGFIIDMKALKNSRRPVKSAKSYPEKALEELEEYFERSADGWTIYTHKLTPEDEIEIGNVCDKYNCDFALGTSHVSIYASRRPVKSAKKEFNTVDDFVNWAIDFGIRLDFNHAQLLDIMENSNKCDDEQYKALEEYFRNRDNYDDYYSRRNKANIKSSRKPVKSNLAKLHTGNIEDVCDRLREYTINSKVDYWYDNEDCFIDITSENSVTGNSTTWSFCIDFGNNTIVLLEPYESLPESFESDNQIYSVIRSMLRGGWRSVKSAHKPEIKKSDKITSVRVNELTEQEKDDLYEIEKNEAEEYYNSLDDSDKQMLRIRYGIKNVKDYVKFFIVHPGKLSDDYEFMIDPRTKLNSRRPVKSARYLVEDENGEVIAETDTYEEAQSVGGATIIDTQQEIESALRKIPPLDWANRWIPDINDQREFVKRCEEEGIKEMDANEFMKKIEDFGFTSTDSGAAYMKSYHKGVKSGCNYRSDNLSKPIKSVTYKSTYKPTKQEIQSANENLQLVIDFLYDNGYSDIVEKIDAELNSCQTDLQFIRKVISWIGRNGKLDEILGSDWDKYIDWDSITSSRKSKKKKWKHPDEVAKDNGADITCARKPSNLSREELVARICEKEDDNYSDWSTYELEQYAREIGADLDEDITSSRTFPIEIVKSILNGKLSEEKALCEITSRCRCNRGYAEKILSGWKSEYTDEIVSSGTEDISQELNKDFDVDGNLDSWTREFVSSSGHSATVGGEMVKAARTVIFMWRDSGDKIGSGDGTVNPAARYIVNASDFSGNTEIEALLDNAFFYDDEEYENWVNDFEDNFADYLRDNSYLFQKPNNDDILNYVEDESGDSISVCFVEDADGVEYEFCRTSGDEWECSAINGTNFIFNCDDVIDEKNEFGKDIDRTAEYGEIVDGNSVYSWEACDELDENGLHHCWKVTDIRLMNGLYEVGDYATAEELMRYTEQFTDNRLYDENGNEITDSNSYQLLASSAVTSGVIGEGRYGIEINLNGWKIISKNGRPDGSEPAEFRTRNEALNSDVYRNLVERYGEDKVRVFRQD